MRLFHFPRPHRYAPAWSFTPGGVIWRLLVSEDRVIVGEARSQEEKRVEFFGIDELSGALLWRSASPHDPWWSGLEGLHRGVVLFHGFAKPDMPEHLGIWAGDAREGRPLWEAPDLTFWFAAEGRVYGLRTGFDRRTGVALDLRSGQVVEEYGESLDAVYSLRERSLGEETPADVRFPVLLDDAGLSTTVMERIAQLAPREHLVGDVEVIQREELVVFNYHRRISPAHEAEPRLENRLVILAVPSGKILFEDLIQRHARAAVPDSFFMKGDQLLFVKDGQTLTAISVSS